LKKRNNEKGKGFAQGRVEKNISGPKRKKKKKAKKTKEDF